MVKKVSKSAQLKSKLCKAIIDIIVAMGGSAPRKDIITAIDNSQVFDSWESEVLRSNKKRWVTALDIQSNELVKSGQIIKQNGVWKIFDELEFISGFASSIKTEKLISEKYQPPLPRKFSPEDMDDFIVEKRLSSKEEQFNDFASDNKTLYDLLEPTWMHIIRGKVNPDLNDSEGKDAKMLRNAFLTYERKKAIESIDTSRKFEEFSQELAAMRQANISRPHNLKESSSRLDLSANIKQLSTKFNQYKWETIRLIAATATGIALASVPVMQMTTRGSESDSVLKKFTHIFNAQTEPVINESTLTNDNPLSLSQEIINSCIKAKLEVKVLNDKEITLIIYDLHSMNENEVGLKLKLNVNQNVHGNIKVVIKKND